jgi:hypothetical protein
MHISDLHHHSLLREVLRVHLQMLDHVVKEDSLATEAAHPLGHGHVNEVHMQMVEGGVVVEKALDLGPREPETLLDRRVGVVSDASKEWQVAPIQVSDGLQVGLDRQGQQVERIDVALVKLEVQLQSEQVVPEHSQLYLLRFVQDIINPLAVLWVNFVNIQGLRIFLVNLGSLSDNVLLLFALSVYQHLRSRVNEVALDARVLLGHL